MTRHSMLTVTLFVALLGGCRSAVTRTSAQVACGRIAELCQGDDRDRNQCERTFAQLNPSVDADNIARSARCVSEARTCGEASGCMAGAAMRAGANFLRDFTNGFTR